MDRILFKDLVKQYEFLKEKIDLAILDALAGGQYIGGRQVDELEAILSEYVGTKYCVSCGNGTDALQLVLMAYGIGPGDAVFVPDFTFFATGEIIPSVGATPVFVDVDADTFNMDPSSLEAAIKHIIDEGDFKPAAAIPVDLFGLPANFPRILEIANTYNLRVIEDGAQGFGGAIGQRRACSFGHAATTSFFPAKPLGCYGDGGAIFTDDEELASIIRSMKVHGKGSHKYENIRIGMNSRLDTIQAAILIEKFKAFQEYELSKLDEIRFKYSSALQEYVETPFIPKGYMTCNAQYTIKLPTVERRDKLANYLGTKRIPSMIYYPIPMSQQKAFSAIAATPVSLDVTSELCGTVLSLPMHPYLTDYDVDTIVETVKKGIAG